MRNNIKNFILQSDSWNKESVIKIEKLLRDNNFSFSSYPLKSGLWQIDYRGKYLGPFKDFVCKVRK